LSLKYGTHLPPRVLLLVLVLLLLLLLLLLLSVRLNTKFQMWRAACRSLVNSCFGSCPSATACPVQTSCHKQSSVLRSTAVHVSLFIGRKRRI
jgi:hypothetical protein